MTKAPLSLDLVRRVLAESLVNLGSDLLAGQDFEIISELFGEKVKLFGSMKGLSRTKFFHTSRYMLLGG